jgi:hypothetical protein
VVQREDLSCEQSYGESGIDHLPGLQYNCSCPKALDEYFAINISAVVAANEEVVLESAAAGVERKDDYSATFVPAWDEGVCEDTIGGTVDGFIGCAGTCEAKCGGNTAGYHYAVAGLPALRQALADLEVGTDEHEDLAPVYRHQILELLDKSNEREDTRSADELAADAPRHEIIVSALCAARPQNPRVLPVPGRAPCARVRTSLPHLAGTGASA